VSRGGAALALLPEIVRIAIPAPIAVGLELLTCYSDRLVLRKLGNASARQDCPEGTTLIIHGLCLRMWNYLHIKGKALPK
jgi:hypothetical protein